MSETLCTLRTTGGGGGRYTETSLWTNPSPTSSFATQDVTLSQSMDDFKYLAFKVSNGSANFKAIVSVVEFKNMPLSGANAFAIFPGNANSAGNTYFARFVTYKNTTTVNITTGYQVGGTSQNNTYAIPLEILGLNELAHGTMGADLLWTNPDPDNSSGFASQTVSIDLSNYTGIILEGKNRYSVSNTGFDGQHIHEIIPVGSGNFRLTYGFLQSGSSYYFMTRTIDVQSNGVFFGDGYQHGSSGVTLEQSRAIPVRIYGIKTVPV